MDVKYWILMLYLVFGGVKNYFWVWFIRGNVVFLLDFKNVIFFKILSCGFVFKYGSYFGVRYFIGWE